MNLSIFLLLAYIWSDFKRVTIDCLGHKFKWEVSSFFHTHVNTGITHWGRIKSSQVESDACDVPSFQVHFGLSNMLIAAFLIHKQLNKNSPNIFLLLPGQGRSNTLIDSSVSGMEEHWQGDVLTVVTKVRYDLVRRRLWRHVHQPLTNVPNVKVSMVPALLHHLVWNGLKWRPPEGPTERRFTFLAAMVRWLFSGWRTEPSLARVKPSQPTRKINEKNKEPCWIKYSCDQKLSEESGRSGFDGQHSTGISERAVNAVITQQEKGLAGLEYENRFYTLLYKQSERITSVVNSWTPNRQTTWNAPCAITNNNFYLLVEDMRQLANPGSWLEQNTGEDFLNLDYTPPDLPNVRKVQQYATNLKVSNVYLSNTKYGSKLWQAYIQKHAKKMKYNWIKTKIYIFATIQAIDSRQSGDSWKRTHVSLFVFPC